MGKPGGTQTHTVAEQLRMAIAVADVPRTAADGSPEAVRYAQHIAAEIKTEAAQPQPNPRRLERLLLSGIMAGAGALEQAAATDLIRLASHALQMF